MSKKCVAFSKSKLGLETPDNRKSFYAGWAAALAEQAEQEPVGWTAASNLVDDGYGHSFSVVSSEPANTTSEPYVPLYAAPVQQAEQEPVAYLCPSFVDNYATGRYETCERTDYGAFPTYAAPVRTKDLTDEELNAMWYGNTKDGWLGLFRAVIAADREKNK